MSAMPFESIAGNGAHPVPGLTRDLMVGAKGEPRYQPQGRLSPSVVSAARD